MIQRIIHRLLIRRHFWRHATFSEIAELYMSRSMTMFALRFVMMFASVYLLQIGYDVISVVLFWAGFYTLKALFAWPAALIVARRGPKHGLLYASILFAFGMMLLFSVEQFGPGMLVAWCVVHAFAGTLNNLCYLVDFSKVKHAEHAGKELGYMNIVEKVASGLSPLIGGFIASLFGPVWAILTAASLFLASSIPLLQSAEPTVLHQKLRFQGFPWRLTRRSFVAHIGQGVDIFISATAWSIFLALVIFAGNGDEIYAKIGALASLTLVVGLASAYIFGRLIDAREGGLLLMFAGIINALTHILRPAVTSVTGVIGTNIANESATTGYMMAYNRGVFDTADRSGFRISYLFLMEVCGNLGAAVAAFFFAGTIAALHDIDGAFTLFFVCAGLATLLIITPGFVLYRKRQ